MGRMEDQWRLGEPEQDNQQGGRLGWKALPGWLAGDQELQHTEMPKYSWILFLCDVGSYSGRVCLTASIVLKWNIKINLIQHQFSSCRHHCPWINWGSSRVQGSFPGRVCRAGTKTQRASLLQAEGDWGGSRKISTLWPKYLDGQFDSAKQAKHRATPNYGLGVPQ